MATPVPGITTTTRIPPQPISSSNPELFTLTSFNAPQPPVTVKVNTTIECRQAIPIVFEDSDGNQYKNENLHTGFCQLVRLPTTYFTLTNCQLTNKNEMVYTFVVLNPKSKIPTGQAAGIQLQWFSSKADFSVDSPGGVRISHTTFLVQIR